MQPLRTVYYCFQGAFEMPSSDHVTFLHTQAIQKAGGSREPPAFWIMGTITPKFQCVSKNSRLHNQASLKVG